MSKLRGFTLIELVLTMLLIAILAVGVFPKLFGHSEFTAYTIRDQLLGQLRLVQMQAMNRRGICHSLIITSTQFGLASSTNPNNSSFDPQPDNVIALDDVIVEIAGKNSLSLRFDIDGKIVADGDCAGGCTINIVGSETLAIIIEPEGYIHAQ